MAEHPVKRFLFFVAGGCVALTLAMAFPGLRFDWLAILAGAAYFGGGFLFAAAVTSALSLLFAGFSLHPAWQLALPLLLGLGFFSFGNDKLKMTGMPARGVLLALLILLDLLVVGEGARLSVSEGVWSLASWLTGMLAPGAVGALGRRLAAFLPRSRRGGEFSYSAFKKTSSGGAAWPSVSGARR